MHDEFINIDGESRCVYCLHDESGWLIVFIPSLYTIVYRSAADIDDNPTIDDGLSIGEMRLHWDHDVVYNRMNRVKWSDIDIGSRLTIFDGIRRKLAA
jgi:hypothetical protein